MTKQNQLFRPLFLLSVLLLLINDFYLKFEFHNYLTGKLSDFTGLFAFPFFFSCLLPKKSKLIYVLTGIIFVFWKSSFSQPIFDFANSNGIGINRVVDYADLMALLIMPLSYSYWKNFTKYCIKPRRVLKPIVITVCCFSFIATTLAHHFEELNLSSDFEMQIEEDIEMAKSKLKIEYYDKSGSGFYRLKLEDRPAEIHTLISLKRIDTLKTRIELDSIKGFRVEGGGLLFYSGIDEDDVQYMQNLSKNEIEKLFKQSINKELARK